MSLFKLCRHYSSACLPSIMCWLTGPNCFKLVVSSSSLLAESKSSVCTLQTIVKTVIRTSVLYKELKLCHYILCYLLYICCNFITTTNAVAAVAVLFLRLLVLLLLRSINVISLHPASFLFSTATVHHDVHLNH